MTEQIFHRRGFFSLRQCIFSKTAQDNQINNYPGSDYVSSNFNENLKKDVIIINLHKLFKYCINPIHRKFGTQINLTSVYRNQEVNTLLEGTPNSQHIYGYAADIVSKSHPSSEIWNWCKRSLSYHQLIWEYPERGNYIDDNTPFSWIHISYIEGNNHRENSVSSLHPKIKEHYKSNETYSIGDYTHRIKKADEQLLNEL